MSQTYYSENKMLDQMFGQTAMTTLPPNWYVGLLTTAPTSESGTGAVEVSGGAYARVTLANNKTTFGTAGVTPWLNGTLGNTIAITFPESTGTWGQIVAVAFYDALTSGNIWYYHTLSPYINVLANTTVYFSSGSLTISNKNPV